MTIVKYYYVFKHISDVTSSPPPPIYQKQLEVLNLTRKRFIENLKLRFEFSGASCFNNILCKLFIPFPLLPLLPFRTLRRQRFHSPSDPHLLFVLLPLLPRKRRLTQHSELLSVCSHPNICLKICPPPPCTSDHREIWFSPCASHKSRTASSRLASDSIPTGLGCRSIQAYVSLSAFGRKT